MGAVDIIGPIILTPGKPVAWAAGSTIDSVPIVTVATAEKYKGMAPVPVPPPNTGHACPCTPPATDTLEPVITPGDHTVGGEKMMVMGGMYLQKSGGLVCQPVIAMSIQTVLNATPVVTLNDLMVFMGLLNGAGGMDNP